MAAYVIISARITDPEQFKRYQDLAGPSLRSHGGRVMAAGSDFERMEGQWEKPTVVMLEFESVEQAKNWYESPDYQDAIEARTGAAEFDLIVMPGK